MAVLEIEVTEGQETSNILKPGSLVYFSSRGEPLRGALITDSDTAYYVQAGTLGLAVPVAGPNIDQYPSFEGRLRWRKNRADEPFERSRVNPTALAFLPRGTNSPI